MAEKEKMTTEQHIERHKILHAALDELVADWIVQTGGFPSKNSVLSLMHWSNQQTKDPSERENYVRSKKEVKPGDIVQIDPQSQLGDKDGFFAACYVIVEEVKGFGIQGYVLVPSKRGQNPDRVYGRFNWEDFEFVGHSEWVAKDDEANG